MSNVFKLITMATAITLGSVSMPMASSAQPAGQVYYLIMCKNGDGSWTDHGPYRFYTIRDADEWRIDYQKSSGLQCNTSSRVEGHSS